MSDVTVAVVSDVHFAGPDERLRRNHEAGAIDNVVLRGLMRIYRRHIWLRDVFAHNHLLDYFIHHAAGANLVVSNGDYSCDTAFVGIADPASFQSTKLCLEKLGSAFADRFEAVVGDHELGKKSFFGGVGGMRLASWRRVLDELRTAPFWVREIGRYRLVGLTSSLIALPVFAGDILSEEAAEWTRLRERQLTQLESVFATLEDHHRVILFCHDPSALPFLAEIGAIQRRVTQIEATVIGHLHSNLIFRMSQILSGMPAIGFLGNTAKRLSMALRQAKTWRGFKPVLCPSLAGIELLKDGGFLEIRLDSDAGRPLRIRHRSVPRNGLQGAAT